MTFETKTVLVTGGGGFIGSHLVDALVSDGAHVRVLDNFVTGHRSNLAHHGNAIEVIEGDIRDLETCQRACRDATVVFHQAALGSVPRSLKLPADSFATNVQGTANVLTAARDAGIRRVVYASSSSVYGDSTELPKKEGREGKPLSPYAVSKHMNEELAAIFAKCFDLEPIGLRYFNIYGPRQDPAGPYAAVIPRFFAAFGRGEAPTIHGDGEQSRDFTFVADAVQANLKAATAPKAAAGRAYNVGAEGQTTVNELANVIRGLAGSSLDPVYVDPRPGDVRHSNADISDARGAFDYRPQVAISQGLERTSQHFTAG